MKTELNVNARSIFSRSGNIRSYAELQEQIHRDLLAQNPDWIESDGNCPKCDDYDRRLAELISIFRAVSLNPERKAA